MTKVEFIIIFQVVLAFNLVYDAESVNITSRPSSPLRVLEGQSVTLEWTFSVVTTVLRVELTGSKSRVAVAEATPQSAGNVRGIFSGRGTASTTETNATIKISSLTRTDTDNYIFAVLDNDGSFAEAPFQIIVQYPPSLITRAPNQVILEGVAAITLTCSADGVPAPNITWTKVFANGSDSDVLVTDEQFILASNRTSDGTYRCKASNGIGSDVNHTVNVVVNFNREKVVFTVKSSSEKICKGDIINVTCSAVGKPVVHTYQLFRDDTLVHSSDDSVLFWSQEATAGGEIVYTCVANNTVATANATKAITVNEGSAIEQLENVTAVEGRNATLNCTVTGIPMPSVSWLEVKTGNRFSENPHVFVNVNRKQAGEYICEATNPCGNYSKKGSLSVNFKPEMAQLVPSKATVCQGEIITFTCTANGNPAVHTYQLYVNGIMVNEVSSAGVWNIIMTTGGVFVYKCKVNNTIGTAISENVTITVNESQLPTIAFQPSGPLHVLEGQLLTLKWTFSVPRTFLRVQLGFPGSLLPFVEASPGSPSTIRGVFFGRVNASTTETNATVTFFSLNRTDTGSYDFAVLDTTGAFARAQLQLVVQYSPTLIARAPDQVALEGDPAINLTCTADGEPAPNITWTKIFPNGTDSHLLSTGEQFLLPNNRISKGSYRCKASNGIGSDVNHKVIVLVNYAPEITHISTPQTLNTGGMLTLNCTADGNPAPTITWTRVSTGSTVNMPLTVTGKEYEGDYRCTASNRIGNVFEDTSITVNSGSCVDESSGGSCGMCVL